MISCLRAQCQPLYSRSAFEQVKQPNKWVPRELTENQSNHHFEVSSSLTLSNNNEKFLDCFVTCNKKWIVYNNQWWPAQLSGWNEKFQSTSQSQTCTEKGHGHCLVVCCWSDPLQLSEFQQNHYIWQVCSADQWNAHFLTSMPLLFSPVEFGVDLTHASD